MHLPLASSSAFGIAVVSATARAKPTATKPKPATAKPKPTAARPKPASSKPKPATSRRGGQRQRFATTAKPAACGDGRVLRRAERRLCAHGRPAAEHQLQLRLWRGEAAVHPERGLPRDRGESVPGSVVCAAAAVRAARPRRAASQRGKSHRACQQRLPDLAAHFAATLAVALSVAGATRPTAASAAAAAHFAATLARATPATVAALAAHKPATALAVLATFATPSV